jgi:hypothetical protein
MQVQIRHAGALDGCNAPACAVIVKIYRDHWRMH